MFGLSRSFWLTFVCLALTGATDTVSMVIRNIIRQLETPDRLRGRMTGVNMVFFMGGPQLGELEAGRGGELVRRAVLGRHRRDRLPDRDRLGGGDDAGAAQLSALVILSTVVLNTEHTKDASEYFSPRAWLTRAAGLPWDPRATRDWRARSRPRGRPSPR